MHQDITGLEFHLGVPVRFPARALLDGTDVGCLGTRAAWIDARMRLVPLALAAHSAAFPRIHPFPWHPSPDLRPSPAHGREAELRIAHSVHTPGSYCSAGPPAAP
ncbi:hypothetical protein ACLQ2N_05435 [Streptomyces sp. DT224]|uniref:hypothetical protein n=1 Tax=Streptomyces sp. DT224 TaxID=3393426 RepID=UPI003CF28DAF